MTELHFIGKYPTEYGSLVNIVDQKLTIVDSKVA